jgi:hypothetical protein
VQTYREYTSLHVIQDEAFYKCTQLTIVNRGEGLDVIGKKAYGRCTSLQRLVISPAVAVIDEEAFLRCSSLTCVVLSDENEEFVSAEPMRYR